MFKTVIPVRYNNLTSTHRAITLPALKDRRVIMPASNPHHHRRSIRLPEYDYSGEGAYYIAICAQDRSCLFGDIINGAMVLNECGRIMQQCWIELTDHYTGIELDAFAITPNHVHGIIIVTGDVIRRGQVASPLRNPRKNTLGQILAYYKYQTTKINNLTRDTPGRRIWQRNYWERIIRNDTSHETIRQYIPENPFHWAQDEENPMH